MLGIGCFGIVKLGCGWCCGDFHEKNWVGLGVGVSNCKKNWVGVVVGGCGQLKLGLGLWLGVAVHDLIGLGLWLVVPKPHFAHPWSEIIPIISKTLTVLPLWSAFAEKVRILTF